MTTEQLDELERLEKAATNANWASPKAKKDGTCQVYATHDGPLRRCVPVANTMKPDGDFIAALRNACPDLIALARIGLASEAELQRLRKIEAAAMKWKAAYEWRFDPDMPEAAPLFPHEDLLAALAGEGGGK